MVVGTCRLCIMAEISYAGRWAAHMQAGCSSVVLQTGCSSEVLQAGCSSEGGSADWLAVSFAAAACVWVGEAGGGREVPWCYVGARRPSKEAV